MAPAASIDGPDPSTTANAVDPSARVAASSGWSARRTAARAAVTETIPGARLGGLAYAPLFTDVFDAHRGETFTVNGRDLGVEGAHRILVDDYVSTEDGTGVVHIAAKKQVGESMADPLLYYRENVEGLVALLDSCQAKGVDKVVFSSSAATYGLPDVELVDEDRIRQLNRDHRGRDRPTDVLSFPIDGAGPAPGPRELGDVVICPEHTEDPVEAAVHGVLHLCGYDHEADDGEMLVRQAEILRRLRG